MLKECLEVFEDMMEKSQGKLVLDTYIPADGTYLIVDTDGNIVVNTDIVKDKKTKIVDKSSRYFQELCFYDYQSQLLSMNKPVDPKKIIHSSNYLSFFIKKESVVSGKLTGEVIDGYYDILKEPGEKKYKKSKEASRIYELFEKNEGKVDQEAVERNRQWIKEHIFHLEDVDFGKKDYLKIFFQADRKLYERESRRYILPNIYNNNKFNVEIEGKVYGMPDNNLGMNAKKPFLSMKSRKCGTPYLVDGYTALLQKTFFDYLMNLVSAGKYHIYVDTAKKMIHGCVNGEAPEEVVSGHYFCIRKGKTEAEIYGEDNIPGYKRKLDPPFTFRNVLGVRHEKHPEYEIYGRYYDRVQVGSLIDQVLFSNFLENNYSMKPEEINMKDETMRQNILFSKDAIFDWIYKGREKGIDRILQKTALAMIKCSAVKDYREKVFWQFNLKWSFQEYFSKEKGEDMGEIITGIREKVEQKVFSDRVIPVESDREYYYCVGQLAGYLISLSKAKDKKQSLINPIINGKTDEGIKRHLLHLYKKYNYTISDSYKRVKNLLAMVEGYRPETDPDQEMIILGYACDNVIYKKEGK